MDLKETYEELSYYMVTDCSISKLSSLVDKYINYSLDEILIPEGEYTKGRKYLEFNLDKTKFNQLVIDLLYAKKN